MFNSWHFYLWTKFLSLLKFFVFSAQARADVFNIWHPSVYESQEELILCKLNHKTLFIYLFIYMRKELKYWKLDYSSLMRFQQWHALVGLPAAHWLLSRELLNKVSAAILHPYIKITRGELFTCNPDSWLSSSVGNPVCCRLCADCSEEEPVCSFRTPQDGRVAPQVRRRTANDGCVCKGTSSGICSPSTW